MIDTNVSRDKTDCIKWNVRNLYHDPVLLPMWIADMDIATPAIVMQAIQKVLDTKVLGYVQPNEEFYNSIISWENQRHQVAISKDQIILSPGVTTGLSLIIRNLTKIGDTVLIFEPYYTPYKWIVEKNQRKLLTAPLQIEDGKYKINFDKLTEIFEKNNISALIFCNPHNPGGRVWSKKELMNLYQIILKYKCLLISDEIHNDIEFSQDPTISLYSQAFSQSDQENTIVLKSASKAFNLAGIKTSFIFCKNLLYLKKLKTAAFNEQTDELNTLGLAATEAAYRSASGWLTAVCSYLEDNRNYAINFITQNIPNIKPMIPEAGYLLWLDFKNYGFTDQELKEKLIQKAHLFLNPGLNYGDAGSGYMRLNFAVDRKVLEEGLQRLVKFDQQNKF